MGNSTGAAALESNKEMSYSSKDPTSSQTLLVTVAQKACSLETHGKGYGGELGISLDPFSLCFFKAASCSGFPEPWSMAHKPQYMGEVIW